MMGVPRAASASPARMRRRRRRKAMIPNDFIQTLLVAGRHRRGHRPLRSAQESGRQLSSPAARSTARRRRRSPSARRKQFYHCFGCGAHGTAIGFLMEYGGKSFPEAVEELARDAGLEVPRVERAGRSASGARKPQDLYGAAARRRQVLSRAAQGLAARHRLPEGPRPDRRRSPRASASATRRTTGSRWRPRSPTTTTRRSKPPAWSSPATAASATTAFATASCSRSTTAAAA